MFCEIALFKLYSGRSHGILTLFYKQQYLLNRTDEKYIGSEIYFIVIFYIQHW